MSNSEIAILFFLQMSVILAIIRVVGLAAKKIGQPQVVGEMIAGVILGPSVFGALLPGVHEQIFPQDSINIIYAVSQVGVVIYMFLIGAEFNLGLIRGKVRSAISVSAAGIIAPFILGSLVAIFLTNDSTFFSPSVTTWQAMLFIGAAISITAFPMLARIIYERNLTGTSLGTLALAAGAVDDASAWCILAIVLASFSGVGWIAFIAIGGGLLYAVGVLLVGKPMLARLGKVAESRGTISGSMLSFILMLVMLAAWFTDVIGIYAVFGGFVMGLAMPRGVVTRELQRRLEPMATNFLLPLFFIYSGLNTQLGLVIQPAMLLVTLVIIIVAVAGKGVACWLAARLNGEDNREAMAIGTLMNARGLMELILLNIGLEHQIITPTFYSVMVVMAIVTTLMTSPIFDRIYNRWRVEQAAYVPPETAVLPPSS